MRAQRAQPSSAAARSEKTGHKAPRFRPRDSCLVRSTDLQGLASRLACPHQASVRPSAWGCPSLRVAGMTPRLAPVAFEDLTVPRATEPRATEGGKSAKKGKAMEDKGKGKAEEGQDTYGEGG